MNSNEIKKLLDELKGWGNINSATHFLIKNVCLSNNWPYGEFWLPNKDNTFMIWSGSWSKNEDYFEKFSKYSSMHKFAKGIGFIGRIWKQKKLLSINDLYSNSDFLRTELAAKNRLNSAIGIPIIKDDNVLMILCFFMENFSTSDLEKANDLFNHSKEFGKILS